MTVKVSPAAEAFVGALDPAREKERVEYAIRARYLFACQYIAFFSRIPEKTEADNDIRQSAAVAVVADAFEKSLEAVAEDVAKFVKGGR